MVGCTSTSYIQKTQFSSSLYSNVHCQGKDIKYSKLGAAAEVIYFQLCIK